MVKNTKVEEKLGTTLASLAGKLTSVRGGRLLLALATGALSNVPVASALGTAVIEYKNLYAAAATDERLSELGDQVEEIERALRDHTDQLDLLFTMIFNLAGILANYLGEAAASKIEDLDRVADSLLRTPSPNALPAQSTIEQFRVLLNEKQWESVLAFLDEDTRINAERSRLYRTKALYGLGRFKEVYTLLRNEALDKLSQEELECFIWASFEIGYIVDGTQAISYHRRNCLSASANLFRLSVQARFAKKSVNSRSENGGSI